MELTTWLALVGICLMGAMSPGPSLAVVLKHCLHGGLRGGVICAVSHGLGVGLYALLAVLGLGSLQQTFPILFDVIIFAGAAYLLYLAYGSWRAQATKMNFNKAKSVHRSAAQDGFAIAFLNPKLAVFFVALFSQFIPQGEISATQQVVMVATPTLIDTLWYVLVAVMCSHPRFYPWLERNQLSINKLLAVAFVCLATTVIIRNIL
ncbi:LysE family translocator [Pseudoalteromonas sp. SSDWG2]|uniref:LysE family translocator n=1 Tax=Pseudoalteromonas sp. SSDWG2 TaxID=3139391 RepID=UPI003BA9BF13